MPKKINQSFPVSPDYITWDDYVGELQVYYSEEPFVIESEANWRETTDSLASTPTFSAYALPSGDSFATWQEWGRNFTAVVNGKTH